MSRPTSIQVQRIGFACWLASWQWASWQWASSAHEVTGFTRRGTLRRAARLIRQHERNAATIETVEVTTR